MTSSTKGGGGGGGGKQVITVHILPNISRIKGNQIKTCGQLIEYFS